MTLWNKFKIWRDGREKRCEDCKWHEKMPGLSMTFYCGLKNDLGVFVASGSCYHRKWYRLF